MGNNCLNSGYHDFYWQPGFQPGRLSDCGVLPYNCRGVLEKSWNCTKVRIVVSCGTVGDNTSMLSAPTTMGAWALEQH